MGCGASAVVDDETTEEAGERRRLKFTYSLAQPANPKPKGPDRELQQLAATVAQLGRNRSIQTEFEIIDDPLSRKEEAVKAPEPVKPVFVHEKKNRWLKNDEGPTPAPAPAPAPPTQPMSPAAIAAAMARRPVPGSAAAHVNPDAPAGVQTTTVQELTPGAAGDEDAEDPQHRPAPLRRRSRSHSADDPAAFPQGPPAPVSSASQNGPPGMAPRPPQRVYRSGSFHSSPSRPAPAGLTPSSPSLSPNTSRVSPVPPRTAGPDSAPLRVIGAVAVARSNPALPVVPAPPTRAPILSSSAPASIVPGIRTPSFAPGPH